MALSRLNSDQKIFELLHLTFKLTLNGPSTDLSLQIIIKPQVLVSGPQSVRNSNLGSERRTSSVATPTHVEAGNPLV